MLRRTFLKLLAAVGVGSGVAQRVKVARVPQVKPTVNGQGSEWVWSTVGAAELVEVKCRSIGNGLIQVEHFYMVKPRLRVSQTPAK